MLLPPNIYAFTSQYLCFYLAIAMLLQSEVFLIEAEATGEHLLICVAVGINDLVLP